MNKTSILIADDDVVGEVFADFFESNGFQTYLCDNGETALYLYRIHSPQIIILDIHMPKMDGWEVLDSIRKEDWTTPILIVTGEYMTEEHAQMSYQKGATVFVRKPICHDEIFALVTAQLTFIYNQPRVISFGKWKLNSDTFVFESPLKKYQLTERQAKVLALFLKNKDCRITRREVHFAIWGHYNKDNDPMIKNTISGLRKALKPEKIYIKSLFKKGYILYY